MYHYAVSMFYMLSTFTNIHDTNKKKIASSTLMIVLFSDVLLNFSLNINP